MVGPRLLQLNSNQINWFDCTQTPAQGGLGIPDLTTEAPQQFSTSKCFTKHHVESIKFQSEITNINEQLVGKLKRDLRTLKADNTKSKIESIDASFNPELLRLARQTRDKGESSWLNVIPMKDQRLTLNKQEFRDSLRLRYHCRKYRLPVLVQSFRNCYYTKKNSESIS